MHLEPSYYDSQCEAQEVPDRPVELGSCHAAV